MYLPLNLRFLSLLRIPLSVRPPRSGHFLSHVSASPGPDSPHRFDWDFKPQTIPLPTPPVTVFVPSSPSPRPPLYSVYGSISDAVRLPSWTFGPLYPSFCSLSSPVVGPPAVPPYSSRSHVRPFPRPSSVSPRVPDLLGSSGAQSRRPPRVTRHCALRRCVPSFRRKLPQRRLR